MAHGALTLVYLLAGTCAVRRENKATRPCHFLGVYKKDFGNGVDCGSAPLGAAIETGKDNRLLPDSDGKELSTVAKSAKGFERPIVCFRRARRESVFRETLAGIGRRRIG